MVRINWSILLNRERAVPIILTLVAVLTGYALPKTDVLVSLIFALLILIFTICRFDPRILIAYAILLVAIEAVLTFQNAEQSQNQLAILSYWLIIAGVICLIIDLFRKRKTIGLIT